MEAKPFNLQSPESIAKEYGGNKQRIAQAAQLGIVDPTAAVMAGMFIDRMRSAQTQEAAPVQTVAQQVFSPQQAPAPPAGVAALPPGGAQPPAAPPPGGLGALAQPQSAPAPTMPEMPAPQAPMGMADGGLAALPVPDDMFAETDDYAGGGVVAFAEAGPVKEDQNLFYGRSINPLENAALYDMVRGKNEDTYAREDETELKRVLSPEERSAARKQDKWMALAQLGFGLAGSKSPYFLQGLGEAAQPAIQTLAASKKERREIERDARKGLRDIEQGRNTEAAQRASALFGMSESAIKGLQEQKQFDANMSMEERKLAQQAALTREELANRLRVARIQASASGVRLTDFDKMTQALYASKIRNRDFLLGLRKQGKPLPQGAEQLIHSDEYLLAQAATEAAEKLKGPSAAAGFPLIPGRPGQMATGATAAGGSGLQPVGAPSGDDWVAQ